MLKSINKAEWGIAMTQDEIAEKLRKHRKWLNGEDGGERAYFHGADLREKNFQLCNLQQADLREVNLQGTDFRGAILRNVNLYGANLSNTNLQSADLWLSNLRYSNLMCSNLEYTNLRSTCLQFANLRNANLRGANLEEADMKGATLQGVCLFNIKTFQTLWPAYEICPEEGDFIAWGKGSDNCLIKLLIPESAERTSTIVSRKCRASEAKVLNIWDKDGNEIQKCYGSWDKTFEYTVGKMVYPDSYDPDPKLDYTNGIHFFITRKEAMNDW